ncbi:hypothetical protein KIH27_11305 [Mycobacterium sp. M1]|uniref:Uncharacterized protein n=1 Tax=Mycolicibacter acidiphilus TaxID=2835306 RepID=A0ABS5RKN5_9MYCO|nr:hypothetical protein [Mycolicibacter acidiphilus]MBS9534173.1 hypothetical protein [Mycolicibacter acidiphilus]
MLFATVTPTVEAGAEPATSSTPIPPDRMTDAGGSGAVPPAAAPEAGSPATKIDAARVLENSASVLRAFPAITPEGPATLLEGTAAVLAALGLTG